MEDFDSAIAGVYKELTELKTEALAKEGKALFLNLT